MRRSLTGATQFFGGSALLCSYLRLGPNGGLKYYRLSMSESGDSVSRSETSGGGSVASSNSELKALDELRGKYVSAWGLLFPS
jgi:hypothetical protein